MNNIGIVILCTNSYFCLGVRFVKRFMQFYSGKASVTFYLFTDVNPADYLPKGIDFVWTPTTNTNWVEGTNLKFKCILTLENCKSDYLFYIDSDTNVSKEFDENWFLGDLVGGEHYGNRGYIEKPYDRNPASMAYVPKDTQLPQCYYYGAFWGGLLSKVMDFCKTMIEWQTHDKSIGYEPCWNDESFLQKFFHYNPPTKVVKTEDFVFEVSDKGGIGETRDMNLNTEQIKSDLLRLKEKNVNIAQGKVIEI